MNAARNITDVEAIPLNEQPTSAAERTVHEVMLEAARCTNPAHFDQLMRSRGADLSKALWELLDNQQDRDSEAKPPESLESRLVAAGVRQNILDNLAIARLHAARADRTWYALGRFDTEQPEASRDLREKFIRSRWEYFFGVTFLSMLASGVFTEDAPGVDLMLPYMRRSARKASVHATMLESALRSAA